MPDVAKDLDGRAADDLFRKRLIMTSSMVFFVHIMIPDAATGLTAGVGQAFAFTEGYPEVFSDLPVQLYRC